MIKEKTRKLNEENEERKRRRRDKNLRSTIQIR